MPHLRNVFGLLLLLLLLASTSFAATFLLPANVTAVEGYRADFICESDEREPIEECRFTVHGFSGKIKIFEGVINQKYEFVGEGFSAGHCGLRLLSVERANAGKIKCSLEMIDSTQEAIIDLTVMYPCDELRITANNNFFEYEENDQMEIKCTAEGGFPAPEVSFLSPDHGNWINGSAKIEDNGRLLRCCTIYNDLALFVNEVLVKCDNKTLIVHYAPRMENGLHEVVVPVVMGQDAYVSVNILANPLPNQVRLTKNGEIQDVLIHENKFNATVVEYAWTISKEQLVDIESDWRFVSKNHYGDSSIHVKLTSPDFAAKFLSTAPAVEGSPVDLICESENRNPIKECKFTVQGFSSTTKIFEGIINQKYKFVGEGFSKGQCGLRLLSVERANAGKVTCSLKMGNTTQVAQTDVPVLYPIDELRITSNNIYYEYKENEQMEFHCIARGGFPESIVSLKVGDTKYMNSTPEKRNLTWNGQAEIENNGQRVFCRAEQNFLQWTHSTVDIRSLLVKYSPRMESGLNEVEVPVVLGQDVEVKVKYLANPIPYLYDIYKNGEVQADQLFEIKFNGTTAEYFWTIAKVNQDDLDSNWRLVAINDVGSTTISIKLILPQEKSTEVQATSFDGLIIAIIVLTIYSGILSGVVFVPPIRRKINCFSNDEKHEH